ncbi:MAG: hypothetical protein HYR63_30135 [Proteobacteria bacterium]|nr:hypothetical protein [Pseudomonadota bacterium]MBI3498070.1 hypothetical protein [Pseudomonadota bacterium]
MTATARRSWLGLPAVWVTAVLLVLWLGFETWSSFEAERKLRAAGLADAGDPVNVEVILAISAEQFHMTLLQDVGRLVGVDARHVLLMDVPREALRSLARNYWVLAVRPWAGR